MKSNYQHQFAQIPSVKIERSVFNRSHGHKTTFNAGMLVPIYCDEVLPGDTFNLRHSLFARLSTPIVPIMDNLWMDTFYFFVPNRLVWDNWQKFMGERTDPNSSTSFEIPQVETGEFSSFETGHIADYFGIPVGVNNLHVNALPFRAYNLIYNEWFRDQNLINHAPVAKGDGPDAKTNYALQRRGKRHDYFTSCTPWPQKGDAVRIPIGTFDDVPVVGDGNSIGFNDGSAALLTFYDSTNAESLSIKRATQLPIGASVTAPNNPTSNLQAIGVSTDSNESGLIAKTSEIVGPLSATINDLRAAFQLQKMLERDARGGTRYTEIIRSHFGVISPDARLQRPEYLGGSSQRINIYPVQQTAPKTVTYDGSEYKETTPQGHLAGFGVMSDTGAGFNKSFVEHGWIIGIACVRADLTYQQGVNKAFQRVTRNDFYWPEYAHLGEQTVMVNEIECGPGGTDTLTPFGYQERYAEYRYHPSRISGLFRSNVSAGNTSLDVWHLSQNLSGVALNRTFIEENPPMERVLAVTTEPHIIFDSHFDLKCARPMPVFSVPGLIDHF